MADDANSKSPSTSTSSAKSVEEFDDDDFIEDVDSAGLFEVDENKKGEGSGSTESATDSASAAGSDDEKNESITARLSRKSMSTSGMERSQGVGTAGLNTQPDTKAADDDDDSDGDIEDVQEEAEEDLEKTFTVPPSAPASSQTLPTISTATLSETTPSLGQTFEVPKDTREEERAAVKLQAGARGWKDRKAAKELRAKEQQKKEEERKAMEEEAKREAEQEANKVKVVTLYYAVHALCSFRC